MRHASLFTGIGGFDLAAQWMDWENVFQVEIDDFCRKVLRKKFPHVPKYNDIKNFSGHPYAGRVDILTGGFPCQPYSSVGKRKGTEDARHLWPEMLRTIREIQPRYVVGENVRGLTNWNGGMVFDQVQADLEAEGFEVLPFLLPACAVNAPHRRDRIWFVAHNNKRSRQEYELSTRRQMPKNRIEGNGVAANPEGNRDRRNPGAMGQTQAESQSENDGHEFNGGSQAASSPSNIGQESSGQTRERRPGFKDSYFGSDAANSSSIQLQGGLYTNGREQAERYAGSCSTWNGRGNWQDFPTQPPVCGRDDGVSNRVDRIKSLGNAIVPQVAFEIFQAIEKTEKVAELKAQ